MYRQLQNSIVVKGPKDTVDIEVKENVLTVKSKKLEVNLIK